MIQITITNHEKVAIHQGGFFGRVAKGLSKIGLVNLKKSVEDKIAKQIQEQFRDKGIDAAVVVIPEAELAPPRPESPDHSGA